MKQGRIYTVGQINHYIKGMFTGDMLLSSLYVSGEVSNCKYHTSGHIYFSIKDEAGSLSCIMFASYRKNLAFRMKDGDKVVIGGSIDVYERGGSYQFYARQITLAGEGVLYERFMALKQRLGEMGMFDPMYKKPIPKYAKTIGVVTAPTGAAIRDIQNISHRRNPYVNIILYPALVQGDAAKDSIVRGIQTLDAYPVDVIIVGRGGGSLEDLWAFNEEEVATAIFEAETPIISAVGHETDTTIADYAADLRAPTPSAAAELAVFDYDAFSQEINAYRQLLYEKMQRKLSDMGTKSRLTGIYLESLSPANRINNEKRRAADLENALEAAMQETLLLTKEKAASYQSMERLTKEKIQKMRHQEQVLLTKWQALNPLGMLQRGFSYISDEDERGVNRISQVKEKDMLTLHVTDGTIKAEVKEITADESYGGRELCDS